jgi:hypothetical protein
MSLSQRVVEAALEEWIRWGCSVRPLQGASKIGGKEDQSPYTSYVNDYWKIVGQPTWNGNTPQPWSAAFISFCFAKAGAAKGFPYATGHVDYCRAILRHPQTYPVLSLEDPASCVLAPGSLIWAARTGGNCQKPPQTYAQSVVALTKGTWFCSHCDVVTEVRPGEVDHRRQCIQFGHQGHLLDLRGSDR